MNEVKSDQLEAKGFRRLNDISVSEASLDNVTIEHGVTLYAELNEDSPVYALVGRVAAEWAALEHALDLIIHALIDTDEEAASAVTAQIMGAMPRFRAIEALLTIRNLDAKLSKRATTICERTRGPQEHRNRIVHDTWHYETNLRGYSGVSQRRNPRDKTAVRGFIQQNLDDIEKTLATIREINKDLRELLFDISAYINGTKRGSARIAEA